MNAWDEFSETSRPSPLRGAADSPYFSRRAESLRFKRP